MAKTSKPQKTTCEAIADVMDNARQDPSLRFMRADGDIRLAMAESLNRSLQCDGFVVVDLRKLYDVHPPSSLTDLLKTETRPRHRYTVARTEVIEAACNAIGFLMETFPRHRLAEGDTSERWLRDVANMLKEYAACTSAVLLGTPASRR